MEQDIIDRLILKLYNLFPDIKAYDVKMDSEVEPPEFIIRTYQDERKELLTPAGFFYTYFFEILFFPGHDEPELQIRDVKLELTNAVHIIGNGYRANDDIRTTTIDGVLHVFFSVTVHLIEEKPEDPDIREINTEVKVNERKVSSETIKGTS